MSVSKETKRQIDNQGQVWFEIGDTESSVGFTANFLKLVKECWHVNPAVVDNDKVTVSSPLFIIETNEQLFTVQSPLQGIICNFSDKARNFPEKLTEDDVVCTVAKNITPAKKNKGITAIIDDLDDHTVWVRQQMAAIQQRNAVLNNANAAAGDQGFRWDRHVLPTAVPNPPEGRVARAVNRVHNNIAAAPWFALNLPAEPEDFQ